MRIVHLLPNLWETSCGFSETRRYTYFIGNDGSSFNSISEKKLETVVSPRELIANSPIAGRISMSCCQLSRTHGFWEVKRTLFKEHRSLACKQFHHCKAEGQGRTGLQANHPAPDPAFPNERRHPRGSLNRKEDFTALVSGDAILSHGGLFANPNNRYGSRMGCFIVDKSRAHI